VNNVLVRLLLETACRDPRVVVLEDIGEEQAFALARAGRRPFVNGLTPTAARHLLAQAEGPVVVVGSGAGELPSTDDVALLRSIPGLTILSPCDALELTACLVRIAELPGPVYLRLGPLDPEPVHKEPPVIRLGRFVPVQPGQGQLAWLATGAMVRTALTVTRRWRGSAIWSAPCVKPLAQEAVGALCRRYRAVIVLEDHSSDGGLGSAVTEIAAEQGSGRVCRIGVREPRARCATPAEWLREQQLDVEGVTVRVVEFLRRLPATAAA
jgi:transketolase